MKIGGMPYPTPRRRFLTACYSAVRPHRTGIAALRSRQSTLTSTGCTPSALLKMTTSRSDLLTGPPVVGRKDSSLCCAKNQKKRRFHLLNDLPSRPSGATSCYACDQPATTKEHAPPKSFFPQGRRGSLITVPSCSIHNCDNSPDVEYVRNAIAFLAGLNETGESLIVTAKRSFDHSPALFERTLRSFVVHSPEEQVGTYKLDLARES